MEVAQMEVAPTEMIQMEMTLTIMTATALMIYCRFHSRLAPHASGYASVAHTDAHGAADVSSIFLDTAPTDDGDKASGIGLMARLARLAWLDWLCLLGLSKVPRCLSRNCGHGRDQDANTVLVSQGSLGVFFGESRAFHNLFIRLD